MLNSSREPLDEQFPLKLAVLSKTSAIVYQLISWWQIYSLILASEISALIYNFTRENKSYQGKV